MALNFPDNPSAGDVYEGWRYDGETWRHISNLADTLPAGAIMPWATNAAPANWLLCDGSAVSRTTYAALFSVIGVTYGAGNGSTTFNLPNLVGRTIVGRDSSQSEFLNVGQAGGAKTHTLTEAEMPSHKHNDSGHSHRQVITANSGGPGIRWDYRQDGSCWSYDQGIDTWGSNANITYTGGSGAHNNLQPYFVLNYIIKTSLGTTGDMSQGAQTVAGYAGRLTQLENGSFSSAIQTPRIGLGGTPHASHKMDAFGRIKLRSDGSTSAGAWYTDNAGTETVFCGMSSTAADSQWGIFHSGAWKMLVNSSLSEFYNDIGLYRWRGRLDRAWDNYPSITIYNATNQGPQGEFRIHGYPGESGGDFSIATRSDGGFISGSDARRKKNIEQIDDALEVINQLSGKRFNIINSDGLVQEDLSSEETGKKFGFIGQEAIEVIPEAVKFYEEADEENEIGYASAYSIDYSSVVPLLVEGIKELSAKVAELESRNNGN